MLIDRLRTSSILVAVVGGLLYLDANHSRPDAEGLWLLPLLLFFGLGTAWDLCGLLSGGGRRIDRRPVLFGVLLVSLSAAVPLLWPLAGESYPADCPVGRLGWIVLAAIAAIFVILIHEMRSYGSTVGRGEAIPRITSGSFAVTYVGLPMALMVSLRSLGDGNWGLAALLTMIAVTKSADAGAYFVGKSMGRHKLIPRLSPNKTWEGLAGGVVVASLVAFLCLAWLFPLIRGEANPPGTAASFSWLSHPLWGALLLGPLLTIAGLAGDLAESLVKRDAGAKDSGDLLPGLGGVWDVTDSLIAAVLPAYLSFAAGVGWWGM